MSDFVPRGAVADVVETVANSRVEFHTLETAAEMATTAQRRRSRARLLSYGGMALIFALLAWRTWATWPDIDIDSGRDAYVAARLAGRLPGGHALLYRDLQYQFGPLVPYMNALLFRAFGTHLTILYVCGLAIALTICLLTCALAEGLFTRFGAWACALTMTAGFGFRPTFMNYVYPYTFAASYGILLLASVIWIALRPLRREYGSAAERARDLWLIGVLTGLAAINKIEFAVATAWVALLCLCMARLRGGLRWRRAALAVTLPAGAIPAAVYGYFGARVGVARLIHENLYASYIIRAQHYFYASQMNVRSLASLFFASWRLKQWYEDAAVWAAVASALLWALSRRYLRGARGGAALAPAQDSASDTPHIHPLIVFGGIALGPGVGLYFAFGNGLLGWALADNYPWYMSAGMLAYLGLVRLWRDWSDKELMGLVLVSAGVPLLLRTLGNPGLQYYGNLMIWPTAIVYLFVLFDVVPRALARGDERAQRICVAVFAALLAAIGVFYAATDLRFAGHRQYEVHGAAGTIRTDAARGKVFQQVVDRLRAEPGQTLLVAPEDAFLYVMTGRSSPLPYTHLIPGHLSDPQHEAEAIRMIEQHPPDHVVLIERDVQEYLPSRARRNRRYFGLDYNQRLYAWIRSHYRLEARYVEPFYDHTHWAEVYARNGRS